MRQHQHDRSIGYSEARLAHDTWWSEFWNRSYIHIVHEQNTTSLSCAMLSSETETRRLIKFVKTGCGQAHIKLKQKRCGVLILFCIVFWFFSQAPGRNTSQRSADEATVLTTQYLICSGQHIHYVIRILQFAPGFGSIYKD